MKLRDLLRGVRVRELRGEDSIEVTSVTSDSRLVHEGSLFVAIRGTEADGNRFISGAVDKGAVAIVTEDPPGEIQETVWVQVEHAREALAEIAANFHGHPAKHLSLVGVTGTSGKTTTTKMIEAIFDATGSPVGLIGTIEYRAGDQREIADRTTPDAVSLQEWFARMAASGVRNAVMEVSSHALAMRRTHGVPFAAAVFTNLSRDHFDFHSGFEDYFAAKRILFDQIDRSKKSAIVNLDDEYGQRLIRELGDAAMTFGRSGDADIYPAPGFEVSIDGLHCVLVTPGGEITLESKLLGFPNLYNWMGATGAALVLGIERGAIEAGMRNLVRVPGRFERVSGEGELPVIVDYAHKPDALEKLLHAVRELAPDRRLVVVFGCGGNRDRGKRPMMGEISATLADHSIITSDNPRGERPESIVEEIEKGVRGVEGASYEVEIDRRSAIERAIVKADSNSVVVIAGKGHEDYQVLADRIVHFNDREEAAQALKKRARE
ncbi:MAG TPA: UDP-N-acetylmuramoyl-L-alanyl-D-glutamate--2,6-diaminopimelate ligase [Thermoanaerobaculia bacterium]|nr:UDP-N-acetylmuramoyl-L-alanyl-D-glutamate--2,6-diaminopimelate ligase [Thermoanaerobaculia bacterium]